jgi:LysR family nitrogen assimilation transcriptional regulator
MANIPLRQIRAVIAVCEEGSFTRAAERENATQSGISQHVAAVERTLGVQLFERSTGSVTPTPAGLRYYKSWSTPPRRRARSLARWSATCASA